MKHKKWLRLAPPPETWAPLAACLLLNLLAYYGGRRLTSGRVHRSLAVPADAKVPFVPAMVSFYVLAYPSWWIGFLKIAHGEKDRALEALAGEQIAKLICLACFLLLPTSIERPEPVGNGAAEQILRAIYRRDAPDMLFPSIHCLESWFCFRGAQRARVGSRGYRRFSFLFSLGVFASTVMVRQHVLADIAGGVAAMELGLAISRRTGAGRLWDRLWKHWKERNPK
jgi:hypothetical protein